MSGIGNEIARNSNGWWRSDRDVWEVLVLTYLWVHTSTHYASITNDIPVFVFLECGRGCKLAVGDDEEENVDDGDTDTGEDDPERRSERGQLGLLDIIICVLLLVLLVFVDGLTLILDRGAEFRTVFEFEF